MNKITVGIDISKYKFDAAYLSDHQKWQRKMFDNTAAGYKDLLEWLHNKRGEECYFVMEATGRYGEDLAHFLYVSGCQVSIINPAQIKYYSRSLLKRTKTDTVDSQLIAEFAQRHPLPSWKPLLPSLQSFKDQVRCLEAFKRDAQQTSNRIGQAKDSLVKHMLEDRLTYIQKQIKDLTTLLEEFARDDCLLAGKLKLLSTIPGIRETSAFNLLAELPDLSTFKGAKQLAAYAGLNPSIKHSGISIKGKEAISKTGNKKLRRILFFPAMTAMRVTSSLNPFVQRLREKNKKGKVILVAVMRKLLHIIFGVLKTQTAFQKSCLIGSQPSI